MADTMRITYSGTDIDFSPALKYTDPGDLEQVNHDAGDGTLYTYTFYHKGRWSVPITFFDSTDSTNINTWWQNGYTVTFTPDRVNAPGTTHSCRIINKARPLSGRYKGHWATRYSGTIQLREI